MVITGLRIEPLASHPEVVPALQAWFEAEWPAYYGPDGRGDAWQDLQRYSNAVGLPFGVVAFYDATVCATAALKADSLATHAHLSPWVGAAFVRQDMRRRGIGSQLVHALELQAKTMGFDRLYCATSTAEGLLQRLGWLLSERIIHEDQALGIYAKAL